MTSPRLAGQPAAPARGPQRPGGPAPRHPARAPGRADYPGDGPGRGPGYDPGYDPGHGPEPADRGPDSGPGRSRRSGVLGVRGWVLVVLVVVGFGTGLLVTAFWPGGEPDQGSASGPVAKQLDLAALGTQIGCQPTTTVTNADYKQAVCTPAGQTARLTLTTFSSAGNLHSWLTETRSYGGAYLVGNRWIVNTNEPGPLAPLAKKLGGTLIDDSKKHSGHN